LIALGTGDRALDRLHVVQQLPVGVAVAHEGLDRAADLGRGLTPGPRLLLRPAPVGAGGQLALLLSVTHSAAGSIERCGDGGVADRPAEEARPIASGHTGKVTASAVAEQDTAK
jgi:hypothetical protein